MKEIKLGDSTYIAVEVPEGANDWNLLKWQNEEHDLCVYVRFYYNGLIFKGRIELPDGKYEIIGLNRDLDFKQIYKIVGGGRTPFIVCAKFERQFHSVTPNSLIIKKLG